MSAGFTGRRALVTGAASGIGLATARLLRARGAHVALLDRSARLGDVVDELGVAARCVDVSDPERVAEAVSGLTRELEGACDLLVNCAGVYRVAPLGELTPDAWDDVVRINLAGPLHVARAVVKELEGAPGAIVNVSSIAAVRALASEPAAHYRASKAGLESLTRQMAVEWGPLVRVNAVSPGPIDTSMLRLMDDAQLGRAYLHERVPLGRLGQPEEVARAIAFLLSDEASYITGIAVPVDGGILCC
jgi:NAD(P)-dependent dehydrogenase (short-subunit alcohol dehydrogenase family)